MIDVLGMKRVSIVMLLLALNAALAAGLYLYVLPEGGKVERELSFVRDEISKKISGTEQLRNEIDLVQEQASYFDSLDKSGFLSNQNRLVARRRIMSIQQYTRVLKASYQINSAAIWKNAEYDEIKHVILSSPITVEVEALDDVDFYTFAYWLQNAFPGHVSIEGLEVKRVLDINESTLRAIGSGTLMPLVKGKIDFVWRTLTPEEDVLNADQFGAEGF